MQARRARLAQTGGGTMSSAGVPGAIVANSATMAT